MKTRNKYTTKFEKEIRDKANDKTLEELLNIAKKKYKYDITKNQLRQYLYKKKIRYKDYNENKKQDMGNKIPIGTEYVKPDGMTLIKIAKNKWMYKQRYIYEQYYNEKLTSDDYIIFLDQNRNNFDISNLKKITKRESAIMGNQKIFSNISKITELGILTAKTIIKTKERKKHGKTSKKHVYNCKG